MHPNPAFRGIEQSEALEFARARGFGILSINGSDGPMSAHLPFVFGEDGKILGHMVASNPVYHAIKAKPARGLISVSGPNGYISPDWYGVADQVPTWNYVAVNLRGQISALDQDRLAEILERTSDHFEAGLAPKPIWKMGKVEPDTLARMMRQIRPFEMTLETVESTFKLGQNKPVEVRKRAADALEVSPGGHEVSTLATLMRAVDQN